MTDLDDWFSRCDGILTEWTGSDDAMRSEPSKGEVELAAGDSYYAQRQYERPTRPAGLFNVGEQGPGVQWADPVRRERFTASLAEACRVMGQMFGESMARLTEQMHTGSDAVAELREQIRALRAQVSSDETPQARALRLRRERNTGPADVRGLDGRRRA